MIQGLEKFSEYFKGFEDRYTLIGGVACCLSMEEADLDFRTTKDLDIVLSTEALDAEFVQKFWDFVKEGGYEHQEKSTGEKQFYRFSKPVNDEYPFMLELFSKQPEEVLLEHDTGFTPIPVDDDVSSLSAILLDEDYYQCIKEGTEIIEGVPVLSVEYIIPFKMRAFIDLSKRKEQGEKVDSRNIKKHKKDVLKISQLLSPTQTVDVSDEIKQHMCEFINAVKSEKIIMKDLSLAAFTLEGIIEVFINVYGLTLEPKAE
jgi:hypothetical protein